MTWGADYSFAHDSISGADFVRVGADFVIGYVSDFSKKNLTAANLAGLLAAGLKVGVVFEDNVDDMTGGAPMGRGHALTAVTETRGIGYDPEAAVIFFADDRNTGPGDWPAVLAYMEAAAEAVRWPGYYGDQDSIDFLYGKHPEWFYWQSDSTSFGNGISRNAHIVQRYNDPRAQGLSLDVNDVQREGIPWMGDTDMTPEQANQLQACFTQLTDPKGVLSRFQALLDNEGQQIINVVNADTIKEMTQAAGIYKTLTAQNPTQFANAVAAQLQANGIGQTLSVTDIANAVAAEFGQALAQAGQAGPAGS